MAISPISYQSYQSNNINFKGTNLVNVAQKQKKNLKAVFLGLAGLLGYKVIKDNNKDFQVTAIGAGKEGVLIDYIDSNGKFNSEFFKQTEKEKMMDFLSENYGVELEKSSTASNSNNQAISIKEDNNGMSVYVGQRGEFIPTFYLSRKEPLQKQQSPMITSLREQYIPNIRNRVEPTGQQVKTELSQGVKDLISQGIMTQKEAEMFNEIYNLEGEEFATKAYDLIAKSMGIPKYPKLVVSLENNGNNLGHAGQDITIYLRSYEKFYGKENAKAEIINALRHELEHFKQDIIIYLQKGEDAYFEAYQKQKCGDIARKIILRGDNDNVKYEVLDKEALHYGYSPKGQKSLDELYRIAFEHDTPIKILRTMTTQDFEKLHIPEWQLAKADLLLLSLETYTCDGCFPDKFKKLDGTLDYKKIARDDIAREIMDSIMGPGYLGNFLESEARHAGEKLRDKFKIFQETITG